MTVKITQWHTVNITMVWHDFRSGNWSVQYDLSDQITKTVQKDQVYCFDRMYASDKENPAFICKVFIDYYKTKQGLP